MLQRKSIDHVRQWHETHGHIDCLEYFMKLHTLEGEKLEFPPENHVLTDVTLAAGDHKIPCHRIVLAAASPYFQAMFTSGLEEAAPGSVIQMNMETSTLQSIVKYIYTFDAELKDKAEVKALMKTADILEITTLKDKCKRFLEDHCVFK